MVQSKQNPYHYIIGIILLVAGVIALMTIAGPFSLAQTNGTNGPLNLNINVNAMAAQINGFQLFINEGETPISVGDMVPGIVGGQVNVIMNINVTEQNSFNPYPSFQGRFRLARTHSGTNYYVNTEGGTLDDVLYGTSSYQTTMLPRDGYGACATLSFYNAGSGLNTGALVRCAMPIYFVSDPTTTASSVNASTNFESARWQVVFEADTQQAKTRDWTNIYFEYPNVLGLTVDSRVDLGQVVPNGTPSALANVNVYNKGNQQLDVALKVDKQTDADAWSCGGANEPLVSDVHHAAAGADMNYALMTALVLNSAGTGTQETTFNLERATLTNVDSLKLEGFRFATTRPVPAGFCTLSAILVTALKGY